MMFKNSIIIQIFLICLIPTKVHTRNTTENGTQIQNFIIIDHNVTTDHHVDEPLEKLHWLIGHWRTSTDGKVFWPTIPKMTYREELFIYEVPMAKAAGIRFLNFTARAWSPSVKDHMHNELGFMTIDHNGNVTLMTTADNGFSTMEEGWLDSKKLTLKLKKIGRISFSRDLPVEDIERKFELLDDNHLEQTLAMRTSTHPRNGVLDHAAITYEKVTI